MLKARENGGERAATFEFPYLRLKELHGSSRRRPFPLETELFGTRLNTNWWDDVSWLTSDCWTGEPQLDHDSRTVLSVQPTSDKAPVLCELLNDNTATVSSETVRKRFYCKVWRCPKSYSRAEHLRRHINEGVALSRPSDTERTNAWQET